MKSLVCLFFILFFSMTPLAASDAKIAGDIGEKIAAYLLPETHPIKNDLDALFRRERVTASLSSLRKNGFKNSKLRQPTNIIVGRHPDFPLYLFKLFLDTQPVEQEWGVWLRRIEGAAAIQACIDRHGFQEFIVPKKWIYPLPEEPLPKDELYPKQFILVVEYLPILSAQENLKAFKKRITKKNLERLFVILTEEGLIDSVYPDNIPFTKMGKIAFIDTEHCYPGRAVPYEKLTPYLSPKNRLHWNSLYNNNGALHESPTLSLDVCKPPTRGVPSARTHAKNSSHREDKPTALPTAQSGGGKQKIIADSLGV